MLHKLPRWHALIQASLESEPAPVSRFIQLATLTAEGLPAVRTVVFRGWHQNLSLITCTDTRSDKVEQLHRRPFAEVCWYFQQSRQQFRITGDVTVVGAQELDASLAQARVNLWQRLSPSARIQFAYPPPGAPRSRLDENLDQAHFNPQNPDPSVPLDAFNLLLVDPQRVDFLDLRANQRILFTKNSKGSWIESEVNP